MLILTLALFHEAKPIIDTFGLKRINAPFLLFAKDHIKLVISGVGSLSMATAVGFTGVEGAKWLNIGLAGHKNLAIGSPVMIHTVSDGTNAEYPSSLLSHSFASKPLTTVRLPQKEYIGDSLYDMEGFGFIQAAKHFSPFEFISLLKIVSDSEQFPLDHFSGKLATSLIEKNLDAIEYIMNQLLALPSLPTPINLAPYLDLLHFTETEKHQLSRLLERTTALGIPQPLPSQHKTSSALLHHLSSILEDALL